MASIAVSGKSIPPSVVCDVKSCAGWLEASRIPGADDDAAAAPPPWSLVEAHDDFSNRVGRLKDALRKRFDRKS